MLVELPDAGLCCQPDFRDLTYLNTNQRPGHSKPITPMLLKVKMLRPNKAASKKATFESDDFFFCESGLFLKGNYEQNNLVDMVDTIHLLTPNTFP